MAKRFRVTYATLSADNEDLHAAYDEGAPGCQVMVWRDAPRIRQRAATHRLAPRSRS